MKYTEILNELKERGASKIKPLTPFADLARREGR